MPARIMMETVALRYEFSDRELADMGKQIGGIYQEKQSLDEEESAMKAQIKERKSALELKIGSLSRTLNTGFEIRQIECSLGWDQPSVGEISYFRKDTGELVKVRAQTVAERQLDLPLEGNGGPQLLEFPQQVEKSVEKSAAAISEFFDTADKAQPVEEKVVVVPPGEPTQADLDADAEEKEILAATAHVEHPEPPVDWQGSQEEYEAMLSAQSAVAATELPPMSPPAKGASRKRKS